MDYIDKINMGGTSYDLQDDGAVRMDGPQSLEDEQKAQARVNIGAADAASVVNYTEQIPTAAEQSRALLNLVPAADQTLKGMTKRIKFWTVDRSGMTNRGVTVSRTGSTVTINGTATGSGTQASDFRLSGDATYGHHTAVDLGAWAALSPFTLRSGVTYKFRAELVSGSMTAVSFGMYNTSGTGYFPRIDPTVCNEVTFVGDGSKACIMIYTGVGAGSTASSAVVEVSLIEYPESVDIAQTERNVATSAHAVGDLLYLSGKLYKATAPISANDTLTVGTNIALTDVSGRIGEAKAEAIAAAESGASDAASQMMRSVPIQYTLPSLGAYVNATTGATASATGYSRTDFIDLSRYTHILYSRLVSTSSTALGGIAFYSSADVSSYISGELGVRGASDYGYETTLTAIPAGAKYARFTLKNDLTGFSIVGITESATDGPLKGKHLSLLGDSMSAYEGHIPSGNRPYYNGTRGDVKRVGDMWWSKLCEITGMEPLVIDGWSGSSICYNFDNASDHPSEEDPNSAPMCSTTRTGRLASNGTNPDVIIVAGGTNDYSYGNPDNGRGGSTTPIGTWNGKTAINTTDVDNGSSTFMETYATMIRRLQTNYPKAMIVCLSCWYTWRGTKAGDGSMRLNLNGDSAPDYSDAIRKVCGYLGVPFVDIYNVGFSDSNYYPYYASDSSTVPTHMNPAGHAVVARKIAGELARLAAPIAGA